MTKVDVILDAVAEMIIHVRGIADSLQIVADALRENKEFVVGSEAKVVEQIPEKTEIKPKKGKAISLEDVRGILAQKSQAGHSAEVKVLITKYGADKLSAIDSSKYEELIKDAEEIGDE